MSVFKILTADIKIKIFNLLDQLFLILNVNEWVKEYIFWELKLLELVGYNLELEKIVELETTENKKKYFVKSNSEKNMFLIF